MHLEHYSTKRLQSEIIAVLRRHLDLRQHRVFFFGSRVAGRSTERSDIDVSIEGPNAVPSHVMNRVRQDVEDLGTMYTIEIVDFQRVSPEFRAVALQHVEPLPVASS